MSSSSSPIELTILSVKLQDSDVHHAASHVYAVVKKKKKKKKKIKFFFFFFFFLILSFNLVKVQDCWMLKFKEILGYISWSSSGVDRERERERERKREEESTLLWLSSLARVRLHLRCFGFFFPFFSLGGAILGVFFSKFRSSSSKSKVFPEN